MGESRPPRRVIAAVPPVGFYGSHRTHPLCPPAPQDVPLPACLAACLNFLGEGWGSKKFYMSLPAIHPQYPGGVGHVDRTFVHLLAASGAAFRLTWKPGWHPDNVATFLVGEQPGDVFDRTFAAAGRQCVLARSLGKGDPALREAIIASINRGLPVIAHGVIGPPEGCVITGYDDDGAVLVGWNFFQNMPEFNTGVEFEPDGQFRKRHWLPDTWSALLIGPKTAPVPVEQSRRETLGWAVDVIRTPRRQERCNGLAAFDTWREHLLRDDEFAQADQAELAKRVSAHMDATEVIAEGRWYAHVFCRDVADELPALAENLWKAAACFDAQHTLIWEFWQAQGGTDRSPANARRFADPELRRICAAYIVKLRDLDASAADHLERALT